MMKKFGLIFILLLCSCGSKSVVLNTVDEVNDAKWISAKEGIKGFAKSVEMSYYNYLMDGLVGNTSVLVDGKSVNLDVSYNGTDIFCDNIVMEDGVVSLFNCRYYDYVFDYIDGDVIKK